MFILSYCIDPKYLVVAVVLLFIGVGSQFQFSTGLLHNSYGGLSVFVMMALIAEYY